MRSDTDTLVTPAGITAAVAAVDRTRLELADGRSVVVPFTPDRRSAAALRASVRRLTSVEIDAGRRSATASGTGFRRPCTRAIPVSMALGLVTLGIPGVAR